MDGDQKINNDGRMTGRILGFLPNMIEGNPSNETKTQMAELHKAPAELILPEIHQAVAFRASVSYGMTIFDYAAHVRNEGTARAAQEMQAIVNLVEKRLNQLMIPNTARSPRPASGSVMAGRTAPAA